MKRTRIIVGLAMLSCLVVGSATIVGGQLTSSGQVFPPVAPGLPQVPEPPLLPALPNSGQVLPGSRYPVQQPSSGPVVPVQFPQYSPPAQQPVPLPVVPPLPQFPDRNGPLSMPAQQPVVPPMPQYQDIKAPLPGGVMVPAMPGGPLGGVLETRGPAAVVENPTGHQEPAVSLDWVGPSIARLNQPTTFQIMAKNISAAPVHNVIVRYRVPSGVQITGSDPKAINEGMVLTWDLGTLTPAQEKRIDLQLLPQTKAAFDCQASVTFSGSSTFTVQVREPRLVVKAITKDEQVVLADVTTVSLNVSNPGDGTADHVRIKVQLPDGLEYARGQSFELDLGSLAPGENRAVQLVCLARSAGPQLINCVAFADAGLTAQDTAKLNVVLPRLDIVVAGPKLRYLDRHATFVFKVTNPGSAPASNVSVVHPLPQGFKFSAASNGGRHDFSTRTVIWFIGDLAPGESREVSLDVIAANIGEHRLTAVATGARGLKCEGEMVTRVEGLSALLMELVDTEDPIEVGAETCYEIRVTNTGSKTETNLQLVCTVPDKMEFRGAKCAAGCKFRVEGKEIIFENLPRLAPRADVVYRVVVRGLAPGDMRFRALIRADGLSEPVRREESTKVYGD